MNVPPSSGIVLTIVVPAFNEGDNLGPVLDDSLAMLNSADYAQPYELIVVNDGSSDHTGQVADSYARRIPCIRVFHHQTNQGLGAALRTGFTESRGEYVTMIPADGEIKADQAAKLLHIAKGADFITTTRLAYQGDGKQPGPRSFFRGFCTWTMHLLCRICLGIYPKHFTGIYMARGPFLRSIPLRSRTGLVGMELYLQSLARHATIRHGEISIRPRLSGQSKVATMSGIAKSLIEMFKVRWYVWRNRGITLAPPTPVARSTAA